MGLLIIVLLFALTISKDLLEFRTFSLNREEDLFYIRIALGLIAMALIVAGIDRFEQWLEITYKPEIFFINDLLLRIPFNDLSVYFKYDHSFFLKAMRAIYHFGFFVPYFFLLLRAVARRDFRSLSLLAFGTLAFHYVAHFPFYFFTEGHQIWYVKGVMVPLFRTVSPLDHVFPSMHTSMSVTCLLLAWQQPNKWMRALYSIFCPLVIFATFYLQIHWTVDAIAGAFIGVAAVQFANYATDQGWLYSIIAKLGTVWGQRQRRPVTKSLSRG